MNYNHEPRFPYVTLFIIAIVVFALIGCGGGNADDNYDTGEPRVQLPVVDCVAYPEQCQ